MLANTWLVDVLAKLVALTCAISKVDLMGSHSAAASCLALLIRRQRKEEG